MKKMTCTLHYFGILTFFLGITIGKIFYQSSSTSNGIRDIFCTHLAEEKYIKEEILILFYN